MSSVKKYLSLLLAFGFSHVSFATGNSPESPVTIPELVAATQHVYVSSSTKSEDGEIIVVSYNADDSTTTGLGIRIHFDSSVLSESDITAIANTDLIVNGFVESDDSDDDGDANTDKFITFGWASLFGSWPGSAPAELVSITFDFADGATGSTPINLTATSNAAGFAFDGQSHSIVISGESDDDPVVPDETAPVVTAPSDITVDAVDANGTPASNSVIGTFLQGASASDDIDGDVSVTNDAPSEFPLGSTTVTFSATDSSENTGSASAIVTVEDNTAPVLTAPEGVSVDAVNAQGTPASNSIIAAFLQGASASDNVDGVVSVTNDAPTSFQVGTTTVKFEASDAAGNISTGSSTVVVNNNGYSPVLTVPSDIEVAAVNQDGTPATSSEIASFLSAVTAVDPQDGNVLVTNNAPEQFPLSQTVVTFSAIDNDGYESQVSATVTVTDQTAPVLTAPSNIQIESYYAVDASDDAIAGYLGQASATDNVDASIVVTSDTPTSYPIGSTTVTFTATDSAGNTSTETSIVTINEKQDVTKPVITVALDPLTITATGKYTGLNAYVAGVYAIDDKDGEITPSADKEGPFLSGTHTIKWSATDDAGNKEEFEQTININPIVSMGPSSRSVEGSNATVTAVLSGEASTYPVSIPLDVSGTAAGSDYTISGANEIVITTGTIGNLVVDINEDSESEIDETITFTISNSISELGIGAQDSTTIHVIDGDINIPPAISLSVNQNAIQSRIVYVEQGLVTVSANITDLNDPDLTGSYTVIWDTSELDEFFASYSNDLDQYSDNETYESSSSGITLSNDDKELTFNPSTVPAGTYTLKVSVSDEDDTTDGLISVKINDSVPPTLSAELDSDGDGTPDADEGYGDSDGDGIPDYADNISESFLAPVGDNPSAVMQAPAGTTISLGSAALDAGDNSVGISEEDLAEMTGVTDSSFDYPSGLFDFSVSGAIPGETYTLVLPLSQPVPENAVFRKFMNEGGWKEFTYTASDSIASAEDVGGACPGPGSDQFVIGLASGHTCIQLTIEDGGPNDTDGVADGTVTDPSGLAVSSSNEPAKKERSGCSVGTDTSFNTSQLLVMLILLLATLRRRLTLR